MTLKISEVNTLDAERRRQIRELLDNPVFSIQEVNEKWLEIYDRALTHSSFAREIQDSGQECKDNERLEFLGNFVLGFVVAEHLYEEYDFSEGKMTRRMTVTSDEALAEISGKKGVDLGRYMRFSKGELAGGGRQKESNIAGALEALIGAIYRHKGIDKVGNVILVLLSGEIRDFDPKKNYISRLQEYAQNRGLNIPEYSEERIGGEDHSPVFKARVRVEDVEGIGKGKSKSTARKEAARRVLEELEKRGIFVVSS